MLMCIGQYWIKLWRVPVSRVDWSASPASGTLYHIVPRQMLTWMGQNFIKLVGWWTLASFTCWRPSWSASQESGGGPRSCSRTCWTSWSSSFAFYPSSLPLSKSSLWGFINKCVIRCSLHIWPSSFALSSTSSMIHGYLEVNMFCIVTINNHQRHQEVS